MNGQSILIGLCSFLLIGLFHPIVIKVEYHWGKRPWPVFFLCGMGFLLGALWIKPLTLAAILAIAGFSCLWSIKELFEQERRVQRGWFPKKPSKIPSQKPNPKTLHK